MKEKTFQKFQIVSNNNKGMYIILSEPIKIPIREDGVSWFNLDYALKNREVDVTDPSLYDEHEGYIVENLQSGTIEVLFTVSITELEIEWSSGYVFYDAACVQLKRAVELFSLAEKAYGKK